MVFHIIRQFLNNERVIQKVCIKTYKIKINQILDFYNIFLNILYFF